MRLNKSLSEDHSLALEACIVISLVAVTRARKGVWGQRPQETFDLVLLALA